MMPTILVAVAAARSDLVPRRERGTGHSLIPTGRVVASEDEGKGGNAGPVPDVVAQGASHGAFQCGLTTKQTVIS
jgi:hypothetical protein